MVEPSVPQGYEKLELAAFAKASMNLELDEWPHDAQDRSPYIQTPAKARNAAARSLFVSLP